MEVKALLQQYVDNNILPNVSLCVAKESEVLVDIAIGTNVSKQSEQPLFRLYSQSKVVTAVAFLILLERDLIQGGIDAEVGQYVPTFAQSRLAVLVQDGADKAHAEVKTPLRPITLRHLLTHTSGLDYSGLPVFEDSSGESAIGHTAARWVEVSLCSLS
jgi:CubicO group peptidase (beta-lactamase class C family)